MIDSLVNGVDSFFVWLNSALKQNLADYIDLETAQEEYTLVAKDGSLLSIIRIDGYRSLIDNKAYYKKISSPVTSGLDPFFTKSGHAMQIWFSVDPRKSERIVKEALAPSYETIKRLNLDLEEILDERVKNISSLANYEECYIVLYTTPAALVKHEIKQEIADKKKMRMNMKAPLKYSQDPFAGNGLLQNTHSAYVEKIYEMLASNAGIACEKLSVYEAAREIRRSIDDEYTANDWLPSLPGDPIAPSVRKDLHKAEEWDIVWPKLNWQVAPRDAEIIDNKLVRIGEKIYCPGYIDLMPKEIFPFSALFNSIGKKYPWRISFFVESDGISAVTSRAVFASILGFVSGSNKLLNQGVKDLREMRDSYNVTVARLRVSFCTWGHKDKVEKVLANGTELANSISSWGSSLVSEVTGDPLAGVISSALGATRSSVATLSAVPLDAIPFMAPFSRPSSPWRNGSVLFLSPDYKLMPYQPGSSLQTTWIQLIFAKPGSGKSVLMNITNLALCLAPGIERLPRIGIVDIGPSSSGLVSLLKEALPQDKKHYAQYYRMRMTDEYAVNPFDTFLGCRYPTAEQKSFLMNFITLLVTDASKDKPVMGISELIPDIINLMYDSLSERGKPRKYDVGVDVAVDNAVEETKMHLDMTTTWWEVVDWLATHDKIHQATLAQRHAVPILYEASAAAQDEKIKALHGAVVVSETQEPLVQYFIRSISGALGSYPILSKPTRFDIGDAKIVSLDLDEVAKTGGPQADKQTAIMYLLARYILGKDYKMSKDTVNEMPYPGNIEAPDYIPVVFYKDYHKKRIEETKEDYKRLCLDEFHRTSKSPIVRQQIVVDMREGRKFNLDVTLASQSIKDFDDDMRSFATSIFIMDGGNERDIQELVDTFGMDDDSEREYLSKGHVHGPRNGKPGVFMAKFNTNTGKYTQLLRAYVGSMEMWALSTTSEDCAVRDRLYERVGPAPARKLLAEFYPWGVKKVIEDRKQALKDNGGDITSDSANKKLFEALCDEILIRAGYKTR